MKRIGILGPGAIAQLHLACWQQLPVEIAAHYDLRPEMAEQAAQQFGGKACTDLNEFFDLVDVVDICTPAAAHKSNALAAIAAGKPTICEKPLARHLADCEAIVEAVETSDVPFFVAHVVRFFPEFKAAKQAIDNGAIGNPGVIRTIRAGSFPRTLGSFYGDFTKSGGVILDVGIHDIDFQRWCMGEVERVFARGLTFADEPERDHALITLRFANGGIGHIEASWASPPGQWRTALEIAGTEGLLEWDAEGPAPITQVLRNETNDGKMRTTASPLGADIHPYTAELAHFLDCLETGATPLVTARDAMLDVKVALAAIESMRIGKPITMANFEEVQA
ncbi:MAG: Gfo/Idh/MocA family oxidoreductase [Caldilineaceae bacterium]|nr:Gfo/Idh/MocA family oxidoreductase [Caldilineaceae bacterium]